MVKAKATLPDGRVMIILGISDGNVERLKQDQPIYFNPAQLRIAPGTEIGIITLFYGADEAAMTRTLKTLIGPETEVLIVPRGDARPQ